MKRFAALAATVGAVAFMGIAVAGSSHREAPGITKTPKLDGTDFYMFRSFEAGRADYVTFLANYLPLQDVYGGPNFFTMGPRCGPRDPSPWPLDWTLQVQNWQVASHK